MQAVREPGGFQPVGEQVQFQGGEADGGLAGEGELFRASLGHDGGAVAQQRLDVFQPNGSSSFGGNWGF